MDKISDFREFKVRKIIDENHSFQVEVEFLDNGDRRKFGFPKGNNWEDEINGVPKFVTQIKRMLEDEGVAETSFDVKKAKKVEGMVFKKLK